MKISKDEQDKAQESFDLLSKSKIKKSQKTVQFKVVNTGEVISLPIRAYEILEDILKKMANGNSVELVENDELISTQKAAELLQVSRPHIVKLIDKGEIKSIKVGTHRRVKISDLLRYKANLKKLRDKNLKSLAKQGQDLDMGY